MNYLMHERLTRDNLHGIWAAVATPFDAHDRFDEDIFRENIRRLHAAGKVKFSQRFRIHTSARRLQSEGLFKIAVVYAANFFSEVILHKQVTKEYVDIR